MVRTHIISLLGPFGYIITSLLSKARLLNRLYTKHHPKYPLIASPSSIYLLVMGVNGQTYSPDSDTCYQQCIRIILLHKFIILQLQLIYARTAVPSVTQINLTTASTAHNSINGTTFSGIETFEAIAFKPGKTILPTNSGVLLLNYLSKQ